MHIPRTEYGDAIDDAMRPLRKSGKTQAWLIEEVHKKTGRYFDDSYLNKIKVGTQKNPKMIAAINEILQLEGKQNE